jgi:outer membrane protein OmpA-like peptidoglycan-associated protein
MTTRELPRRTRCFLTSAQAVVAWLVSQGVAAGRFTAKWFGQTKPIADNASEEGRARNHRVELARQ